MGLTCASLDLPVSSETWVWTSFFKEILGQSPFNILRIVIGDDVPPSSKTDLPVPLLPPTYSNGRGGWAGWDSGVEVNRESQEYFSRVNVQSNKSNKDFRLHCLSFRQLTLSSLGISSFVWTGPLQSHALVMVSKCIGGRDLVGDKVLLRGLKGIPTRPGTYSSSKEQNGWVVCKYLGNETTSDKCFSVYFVVENREGKGEEKGDSRVLYCPRGRKKKDQLDSVTFGVRRVPEWTLRCVWLLTHLRLKWQSHLWWDTPRHCGRSLSLPRRTHSMTRLGGPFRSPTSPR